MNPVRVDRVTVWPSNAWLVHGPDGMVLVDAGAPWSARTIMRRLAETPVARLRLIYLTHAHVDHHGAAASVREQSGAPIAIHHADADSLSRGESHLGMVRDWHWSSRLVPRIERSLRTRETTPDVVCDDGQVFQVAGLEASVMHTPGHTPGSSTLLLRDAPNGPLLAFAGDLVLASGTVHNQRSYAVDWGQVARSVWRLQGAGVDMVYPGHGGRPVRGDELEALRLSGPAAKARWAVAEVETGSRRGCK